MIVGMLGSWEYCFAYCDLEWILRLCWFVAQIWDWW